MRPSFFGIIAGGAATPRILDGLSNLWGAYGITLLKSDYVGAAIRVKDALNAEEDIGFDSNGALDLAALSGSTPYRVISVYDQTGNGRTATHTKQPTGVDLILDTADPSLYFNDCYLTFPSMAALTQGEIFVTSKLDSTAVDTAFWAFGIPNTAYVPFSDGNIYDDWGSTVRKNGIAVTESQFLSRNVYDVYSVTGDWANYLNNTQLFTTATNTVGFSATPLFGRQDAGSGGGWFAGDLYNLVIFNAKVDGSTRTLLNTGL